MINQNNFKLDLTKTGLNVFFSPYQIKVFEVLWEHPDGLTTREVWEKVNSGASGTTSRASIINFLRDVADIGLLDFREESGKGGYRRIYWHKYDRKGFIQFLKQEVEKTLKTLK